MIGVRFTDGRGLRMILEKRLDTLNSLHKQLSVSVRQLRAVPGNALLLAEAVKCCLRHQDTPDGVCVFCRTHSLFKEYESKLYRYSQQGQVTTSADSGYNVLGLFVRRIDRSVYFNVVCHQQIP